MSQYALPAIYALLVWWIGTGAILYVVGRPLRTYPVSIAVGGAVLGVALWVLTAHHGSTAWDAYVAFTAAIAVWGFVELTFLTGAVTGVRKTACPADSRGWQRARHATEAVIHHELALVAAGAAIAMATWHTGNPVAAATFALLWVMRLSSKLNLFLGVRFLNADMLPAKVQHLRSYFRRKDANPLFPVSVVGALAGTWLLAWQAAGHPSEFAVAAYMLLATLLALALIEHLFMMIPFPVARLWGRSAGADDSFSRAKPRPLNPT
jgi:putative photosynthetic complex assembly protein 2